MRFLLLLSCLTIASVSWAETLVVRHPKSGEPAGLHEYQVELLTAILRVTEDSHGPFLLEPVPLMPQEREIQSLIKGEWHDVLWTISSPERETMMRPIRFPIYRGMFGHRICLIQKDSPLFHDDSSPGRDQLVIGSGVKWPDTRVFQSNGYLTEVSSNFYSIFRMLQAGRVNCFPRGLSEIEFELESFDTEDLVVEPHLSFLYFSPMYFFVAPERERLAERIELGMSRLQESGEFEEIFSKYFDVDRLKQRFNIADREPICLDTPDVSEDVIRTISSHMIAGPGTFADSCIDAQQSFSILD